MLDANDLDMIRKVMREELDHSENIILTEMDRVQANMEKEIAKVKENLEYLKQYYNITKLENDNTTLMLKMISDLSGRIAELEKRIA